MGDVVKSTWYRFRKWAKQPFQIDPCLEKDDPDYYTAIYSSRIEKFQYLFDTLRESGSYFTPSERSLLTHELLSRTHSSSGHVSVDGDDDDEDNFVEKPVMQRRGLPKFTYSEKIDFSFRSDQYDGWAENWFSTTR